jgi:hypothetical protein
MVGFFALAGGLFEYVDSFLEGHPSHRELFLSVATIGPSITSVQTPRRDMLNFLVQHGYPIDRIMTSLPDIPSA